LRELDQCREAQKLWVCLQAGKDSGGANAGFWGTPDSPRMTWGTEVRGAIGKASGMRS